MRILVVTASLLAVACGGARVASGGPASANDRGPGGAPGSDALSARLDRIAGELAPQGFSRLGGGRGFLLEGDSASHEVELPSAACVTIITIGSVGVRDIDTQLWAAEGTILSTDDEPDPHPIVQTCADAGGGRAYLAIKMFAGTGAYRYLALRSERAVMSRAIALVRGGGPRPPAASRIDQRLGARLTELEARGFTGRAEPVSLTLGVAETVRLPLPVERGGCYTMVAVGGDGISELDVTLTDDDDVEVASDAATGGEALVQLCVDTEEVLTAEVRATTGSGDVRFVVLGATSEAVGGPGRLWLGARRDRPGEVPVTRAVATAEEHLRRGGATVRPTGAPIRLQQRGIHSSSVPARTGSCLAVVAAGGRGLGRLRLSAFDAQGDPLGDPVVGVAWASTRLCPARAGDVRLDVEAIRGWGDVALVVADEALSPHARGARPLLAGRIQSLAGDATADGWTIAGAPTTGHVPSGGLRQHPGATTARCVRWAAAADGPETELHLQLLDRSGNRLSSDRSRGGVAWIDLCGPAAPLATTVEVRARHGGPDVEYRLLRAERN